MSRPQFTPGPWEVLPEDPLTIHLPRHRHEFHPGVYVPVARVEASNYDEDSPEDAANADLIAAAPDLYEALEMVRDADNDCKSDGLPTIPPAARAVIDAALAKARGEE